MREPWKEHLPVKLLEFEMLEVGQRLSQAITKRDKLEERRKHVAKLLKERVDRADSVVHSVNRTLSTGYEDREVLCREEVDLFEKKVRIIRMDTLAVVKERDMESRELQLEIRDAGHAAANLSRMEQQDLANMGNVIPVSPEADRPAQDRVEEQMFAETPEEAEALREARLASEHHERDVEAAKASIAVGREDLAVDQADTDAF